jgi:hypothetical protein
MRAIELVKDQTTRQPKLRNLPSPPVADYFGVHVWKRDSDPGAFSGNRFAN